VTLAAHCPLPACVVRIALHGVASGLAFSSRINKQIGLKIGRGKRATAARGRGRARLGVSAAGREWATDRQGSRAVTDRRCRLSVYTLLLCSAKLYYCASTSCGVNKSKQKTKELDGAVASRLAIAYNNYQ